MSTSPIGRPDRPAAGRPDRPAAPRISPGSPEEIGRLNMLIVRLLGLGLGVRSPNLFTTLARHRRLFRRWLLFAGAMMPSGTLPRADTELVVLRVAWNTRSEYERRAHLGLASAAGLSDEQIDRLGANQPDGGLFSPHQLHLIGAVDELHDRRVLSESTFSVLSQTYDEAQMIELCMLAGQYEMLAMTLNSLGIQPDPPRPDQLPAVTRLLQRLAGRG